MAVPDPVMMLALKPAQFSPLGTLSVRATAPENPFTAAIVIVVVVDWPALTADGVDAPIVKSDWFTVNLAVVE